MSLQVTYIPLKDMILKNDTWYDIINTQGNVKTLKYINNKFYWGISEHGMDTIYLISECTLERRRQDYVRN